MAEFICGNCFDKLPAPGRCLHCGYDTAADAQKFPLALPVGSILNGRYIIGRCLGQGGFGITYVAQDVNSGQKVAIKEFFPETMATRSGTCSVAAFSGQRQENFSYGLECFLEEAKTLSQFIGMPGIVQVYSYFEENGTAYFVMEYVEGDNLQSYLTRRKKLTWEEVRSILLPVMDALSIVHSKGIIHRDVSPDNIYITSDGTVKLLDFGAARYSLGDRSRSLDVVLKAGYAPKEQYIRRGRQGPYTDIYALAATFYRSLTGRLPPESVERMENDELILPSILGCSIPEAAEDALEKALSIQAAERYQTMAEFRAALCSADVRIDDPPVDDRRNNKKDVTISLSRNTLIKLGAGAAALVLALLLIFGIGGGKKEETRVDSGKKTTQSQSTKTVNRVRQVTKYDADGAVLNVGVQEYTYNSQGRTISLKVLNSVDDDTEWRYTYDDDGNQTRGKFYRNGTLNSTYHYSDFVDGKYRTMEMELEGSSGSVSTYVYDKDGNMTSSRITGETYYALYEYSYDSDGNQIASDYEFYYKGALSSYSHTTYTYDSYGDRISELVLSYEEDGSLESEKRTEHSYQRDSEDYLVEKTTYWDDGTYSITEYERVEIPVENS